MKVDRDLGTAATLAAGSWVYFVAVALGIARAAEIPLPTLALFFDGHLYLEIAKSFPLPYGPGSLDYTGYAGGYPAFAAAIRLVVPDSLASWGTVLLLASWIPAALCTGVFYTLCRQVGAPPLAGALLFVVANPRWVAVCATAHSEPLAMLFVLLTLLAYVRGRLVACAVWLTLAGFVRHPAVMLIVPLVADQLLRGERRRTLCWLALPLVGQALVHVYLTMRVPEFESAAHTLRLFWQPQLTWPFASFFAYGWDLNIPYDYFLSEVTLFFAVFYLVAIVVGFRPSERALWVFPMWVALNVLSHASLSGGTGVLVFTRLVILAWPAALLIVWRLVGPCLSVRMRVAAIAGCGLFATTFAVQYPALVVPWQSAFLDPALSERMHTLDHPEPRWIRFPRSGR